MARGLPCVLFLSILLAGAFAQDCNTVVETATSANLTILLQAVEAAGLVDTVNDPDAGLTIFAPTDEAFVNALEALGLTAEELLGNTELLTQILTYHVLPSPRRAVDFGDGGSFDTLLGDGSPCGAGAVTVTPTEDGVTIDGGASSAMVVSADVEACTTVIHVIDAVLLSCPLGGDDDKKEKMGGKKMKKEEKKMMKEEKKMMKEGKKEKKNMKEEDGKKMMMKKEDKVEEGKCTTVVETAQAEGLTTLVAAVTEAGLAETVNNPDAGLTIFAPTDKAFASALSALGLTAEELLANKELLTTILTYHVTGTAYTAKELLNLKTVKTLVADDAKCPNGEAAESELMVKEKFRLFRKNLVRVVGEGSFADVTTADVKACSTIVHVVDFVLLPCDLAPKRRKTRTFLIHFG